MTKEQQDLAWKCLSKEAREEIKKDYKSHPSAYHPYFNEGYGEALKIYFGKHNLTSDTEPDEMLMVERKKVVEWYSSLSNEHKIYAKGTTDRISLGARLAMIEELFGKEKCLPDKEPSVQVEPKFKVGDKVRIIVSDDGEVDTIRVCGAIDNQFIYWLEGSLGYYLECQLEPYTEPESRNLSQETANCDKPEGNQLKDNMEEKELNLDLENKCEKERKLFAEIKIYL